MFGNYKYQRWEEWELEYIVENYNIKSYSEMAIHLKRDERQIRNKVYYERKKIKREND